MPFGPVHRQGHQPAACSCSSLVSTRLTLGKYSCDQTLLPTGKNKASVSERAACSLPAPAHVFPGKVKINPGHRVESGYFSTAGKGQAGQWNRTGKIGKEGKKKSRRGSSVCICSTETPADGEGSQASRQIQSACRTAG